MVEIVMTGDAQRCLMDQLSADSAAYQALAAAACLPGSVTVAVGERCIVQCELTDAETLLGAAQQYCLNAVNDIESAIATYRSKAA